MVRLSVTFDQLDSWFGRAAIEVSTSVGQRFEGQLDAELRGWLQAAREGRRARKNPTQQATETLLNGNVAFP